MEQIPSDVCCLFRDFAYIPGQTATPMFWKMLESSASYRDYEVDAQAKGEKDRLPPGPALLAALGLSLLGWAFVLVPLVAILHR